MTENTENMKQEQAVATPVELALAEIRFAELKFTTARVNELDISARRLYAAAENALARVRRAHAQREAVQPGDAEDQGGVQ